MKIRTLLTPLTLALLALPASAQQADRQAEIEQLEAMLVEVDAAIAALRPAVSPPLKLVEYDLRQLFYRPPDRYAPALSIPGYAAGYATGGGAGGGGGSFTFEEDEETSRLLDPDQLHEILMLAVGEDAWEEPASMEIVEGHCFVRQTDAAHARIRATLEGIRANALRAVQLEVGFYRLGDDLRKGLSDEALTSQGVLTAESLKRLDAAVAAGQAKLTECAVLTALSGQQAYLHQGAEQAYIETFERSSGGTGEVVEKVADPIVEILRTGLGLDMRAVLVEGDEQRVALDVRFARARTIRFQQRKTPWGPIDVPQLHSDAVRTSAQVAPDAGMLIYTSKTDDEDLTIVVRPRVVGE